MWLFIKWIRPMVLALQMWFFTWIWSINTTRIWGSVCAFVWVGWCGVGAAYNGSHCCNHAVILDWSDICSSWQFLLNVVQNNNQSKVWDIYLEPHSGANTVNKSPDFWLLFLWFFLFLFAWKQRAAAGCILSVYGGCNVCVNAWL